MSLLDSDKRVTPVAAPSSSLYTNICFRSASDGDPSRGTFHFVSIAKSLRGPDRTTMSERRVRIGCPAGFQKLILLCVVMVYQVQPPRPIHGEQL